MHALQQKEPHAILQFLLSTLCRDHNASVKASTGLASQSQEDCWFDKFTAVKHSRSSTQLTCAQTSYDHSFGQPQR